MREYIDQLWLLFRKHHPSEYSVSILDQKFLEKEISNLQAISSRKGDFKAYQSHSARSAWIFCPWNESTRWYTGYEYKGIGENGGPLRKGDGMIYGGVVKKAAMEEHRYAKLAQDAGILCQRPLGVYDYGAMGGKRLAVVVRTFTSPIRLSDFLFDKKFFREYLSLRGEGVSGYGHSIAVSLGEGVRKLFDIGLYHGSLGINNITTEGEMADFEPTAGGTWEGVCETEDPFMRYVALRRVLFAGKTTFPSLLKEFQADFAAAFFDKKTDLATNDPAKEIAERYCGKRIMRRLVRPKKGEPIYEAILQVEELKRNTRNRDEIRRYNYVLRTLKMPVPARVGKQEREN